MVDLRGIRRGVVAVLAVGVLFVAGCTGEPGRPAVGATGPGWVGGLRTPSPVPVDINPSAPPVGDTVPTGVVVDGRELVLYVWHSVQVPWLGAAALDRGTGGLTDWLIGTGRSFNGTGEPGHFGEVRREEVPDGTVIYMGMFRGTVDRIVLAEPDGAARRPPLPRGAPGTTRSSGRAAGRRRSRRIHPWARVARSHLIP
ncbi:hypothetical protein ACFQX7_09935 [Luedemannella flava]